MRQEIRLILDPARDGASNMAVDEAMLLAANDGEAGAVLRLYRWAEPALSLGCSQPFAEIAAQGRQVAALPAVRRITGGGAILHAEELTYCLVAPMDRLPVLLGRSEPSRPDPAELYGWMHRAVAKAVESLDGGEGGLCEISPEAREGNGRVRRGPFWCFRRRGRFDLVARGEKLAGSAQRRTARAVLQHGSVLLASSLPAQSGGSVSALLGRAVAAGEFAEALVGALAAAGMSFAPGELSEAERRLLPELRAKHTSAEWLRRR